MTIAYSAFAGGLSQTPVFASPLNRGRFIPRLCPFLFINPSDPLVFQLWVAVQKSLHAVTRKPANNRDSKSSKSCR
jgi:hypothetical protein